MRKFIQNRATGRIHRESLSANFSRGCAAAWLIAGTLMLAACGSNSSGPILNPIPLTLTGNWQFTVSNPSDGSFTGGIQGGFLAQTGTSATGGATYSVALPGPTVCSSGSATVTATLNGQDVALTAMAGTQTFSFTGTMSIDGTTMGGTYSSTDGTASDGSSCGTAQAGLQWSAVMVPPLFGSFLGSFHSTGGAAGLSNQDFLVSGVLLQGPIVAGSSVAVAGSVGFTDPNTLVPDYPCANAANLMGTISGTTVTLQMTGTDGSNLGQIGGEPGSGLGTVTFDTTQSGMVLHSLVGTSYALSSSSCTGASLINPGDSGNVCLGFSGSACQQPFTLEPASLTFPATAPGSSSAAQKVTLTNMSTTAMLTGLTWTFVDNSGVGSFEVSGDTCDPAGSVMGSTFLLDIGKSCMVSIKFTPQAARCTAGAESGQCPSNLTAWLTLTSPTSADNDTAFKVPIRGTTTSVAAGR